MKQRYNKGRRAGTGAGIRSGLLVCLVLLFVSCADDLSQETLHGTPLQVEEGIEGTLTLAVGSNDFEQRVSVLTRAGDMDAESDEQEVHSVYLFVVNKNTGTVIARKYFPDVTEYVEKVVIGEQTLQVVKLSIKAVSCQSAEIFAIANVGYSDLQHVDNDDELLTRCDESDTFEALQDLTARLSLSEEGRVRVERTQGHHLMSGFFVSCTEDAGTHYLAGHKLNLALQANGDGTLSLRDADDASKSAFTSLGANGGNPGAVILQRLDAKVTFNIEPVGELAATEGAYFHLKSWQVKNAPVEELLCWHEEVPDYEVKDSKVFQRDITETPSGGYTFTYYQFENCTGQNSGSVAYGYNLIDGNSIASQYNMQCVPQPDITAGNVEAAFPTYPNPYTNFAYGLRAQRKKDNPDGTPYDPEAGTDETVSVVNGEWEFAPKTATYVLLTGKYYNPSEPVRRRKDDPRNGSYPDMSLEAYPYWNADNYPVASPEQAAKRTRMADVTYVVHLGYVGGGNFDRSIAPIPAISTLDQYVKKVNDYNVLRNHHYTYKIGIAGVNSIKVEATREDGGNAYGQETQPGAEGNVFESQHLFSLDAHYETRNLTIDFKRMPEDCDEYGFRIKTCYETAEATLQPKGDGTYGVFDKSGREVTDIRGHDLDWIHFAWHGTDDDPDRSLIDPQTGNGIPYSRTYGGYLTQQTYNDPQGELQQEKDADHTYYLMNSVEFIKHVWEHYQRWKAKGCPENEKTVTYTIYVDEYFYDRNPLTGANVDWMSFCGGSSRAAFYFMEGSEISADHNSIYTDAHVAVSQRSIQTPYATSTAGGQTVADVAFGIEHLDEFHSKYNSSTNLAEHYMAGTQATENGLNNTMRWYLYNKSDRSKVIPWQQAETYFNDKVRSRILRPNDDADLRRDDDGNRANRRAAWAVYSRNRDLNRDGEVQPDEVRWFIPTIGQYTICFLAGRPAFDYPLYEPAKAHLLSNVWYLSDVPFLHYIAVTGQIFWSEEGCSVSGYNGESVNVAPFCYSIRMARMLTRHGVVSTGAAIVNHNNTAVLLHDPVYMISESRNGPAVTDYNTLADGKNYYVTLNKLNPSAFRDYVHSNDLAQHDHEQQNNWLYREFKIARHKIGYTSYTNRDTYDRTPKIDGTPRTWWQLNGVWAPFTNNDALSYNGPTTSIAWSYTETADGGDLHRWRVPNLREAAIMSLVFPSGWFNSGFITTRTRSANLSSSSTNIPYFKIGVKAISRIPTNSSEALYIRPVHDVRTGD